MHGEARGARKKIHILEKRRVNSYDPLGGMNCLLLEYIQQSQDRLLLGKDSRELG
jgi:hypothetical protein